jgi:Family of unknown function (DUF6209)
MSSTDKSREPPARLQFLTGWQTVKHGSIRPGGRLIIDYDICRPNLRTRFRDIIFWKIDAFVRFHPSGQLHTSSVIAGNFDDGGRRPFRGHRSKPFELVVPRDATRVEIWFRFGCEDSGQPNDVAWDSRFGQNYWFDVIHTQTDKCTDGKNRRLSRSFEAKAAILTHGCGGPAARAGELANYRRSFRNLNRKSQVYRCSATPQTFDWTWFSHSTSRSAK